MGAEPITCPIIVLPTALPDEVSSHLGAGQRAEDFQQLTIIILTQKEDKDKFN